MTICGHTKRIVWVLLAALSIQLSLLTVVPGSDANDIECRIHKLLRYEQILARTNEGGDHGRLASRPEQGPFLAMVPAASGLGVSGQDARFVRILDIPRQPRASWRARLAARAPPQNSPAL